MLRGHVGSFELIRGILNPLFRRNLSAASVRYADEKDRKKADSVFSWLKDIFKPDDRVPEDRNAIDREATETVLDYPKVNQASLINFTLEDVADQNFSAVKKFPDNAQSTASSTVGLIGQAKLLDDLAILHLKIKRGTSSNDSTSAARDVDASSTDPKLHTLCHKLLAVPEKIDRSVRTIMGCIPRNTKPPIREPNMPQKREKKDDKKEKKKKKPVLRTDPSQIYKKDATLEAKNKLHDNLDVNFRHQWAIRLSEDVVEKSQELEAKQTWGKGLQHMQSPTIVRDVNYSSFQAPSEYDADGLQTMKDPRLTMSAAKDSENKTDSKSELPVGEIGKQMEESCSKASQPAEEVESVESSLKRILKTSPSMAEDSTTDEEYNVPAETTFDAEVSAWKDLVLKSKVPLDPSKEEFLSEEPGRRVEMLSIRPEPPQPKLDVQAVPSTDDSFREEEEEQELPKDYKSSIKSMDLKRPGSFSDAQKTDNKKLHTGPFYVLQCGLGGIDGSRGTSRFRNSTLISEVTGKNVSGVRSEFSTSSETRWGRLKETVPKGAEAAKTGRLREPVQSPDNPVTNIEVTKTVAAAESHLTAQQQQLASLEQSQANQVEDDDFADSLNAIAEREIEISLSRSHQEDQESGESPVAVSTQRDQRKLDGEEHQLARSDDFHSSFNYAESPYEDDYFPGFDSVATEPVMEKRSSERKMQSRPSVLAKEDSQQEATDRFEKVSERTENVREDYTTDGDYVRVPGDPYPYSREHFQKWRLSQEDIPLGSVFERDDFVSNSPISNANATMEFDVQPPVRKMSHDARVSTLQLTRGKGVRG